MAMSPQERLEWVVVGTDEIRLERALEGVSQEERNRVTAMSPQERLEWVRAREDDEAGRLVLHS